MKQKSYKIETTNLKQFMSVRSSLLRWSSEQSVILQGATVCAFIHLVKIFGLYWAFVILDFQQFWKHSLTSSLHHLYFACSCEPSNESPSSYLMTFKSILPTACRMTYLRSCSGAIGIACGTYIE